jgi:hypothetical protein
MDVTHGTPVKNVQDLGAGVAMLEVAVGSDIPPSRRK